MKQPLISIGTQIEAVRDEVERHSLQLAQIAGSKREAKMYVISRLMAAVRTLETVKNEKAIAKNLESQLGSAGK